MCEHLSFEVETRKHLNIGDLGMRAERGMDNPTTSIYSYVALHPEIELVSLLGMPHLRVSLL